MSPRIGTALAIAAVFFLFVLPASSGAETSNMFLPRHVEAADGTVSLYADYDAIQSDGRVPVYLINKTGKELAINTQDGDIYLKLEYQDSSGEWARAQPHGYSWCGNSYVQRMLAPGHHWVVNGYQPINGQRRTIRYKLYGQDIELSSNAGDGVVAHNDIQRASSDVMSIHNGSFEYVAQIALSDSPVENNMDHMRDLRSVAIRELASERFDPAQSKEVLLKIRERRPELDRVVGYTLQKVDERL